MKEISITRLRKSGFTRQKNVWRRERPVTMDSEQAAPIVAVCEITDNGDGTGIMAGIYGQQNSTAYPGACKVMEITIKNGITNTVIGGATT